MKISTDSGQDQRQKKHAERCSPIQGIAVFRHSLQLVLTDAVHLVDILADQAFKLFVIPLLLFGIAQVIFHRLAHLLNIFLLLTDAPGPKLLQLILTFYFLFQLTYFADPGIFHRNLRRFREHCAFFFSLFFLFFHFGVLFLCVIR